MAETNNIYLIGIRPDPYTDYATRIIIAPDEDTALAMWRRATEKRYFKFLENDDLCPGVSPSRIHIEDLGPGPVSKVFSVTTG